MVVQYVTTEWRSNATLLAKSMGNSKIWQNSTRHNIKTPEPIRKKTVNLSRLVACDPVYDIWYHFT